MAASASPLPVRRPDVMSVAISTITALITSLSAGAVSTSTTQAELQEEMSCAVVGASAGSLVPLFCSIGPAEKRLR